VSDSSTPDIVVLCGNTGSGSMLGVTFHAVRGSEASLLI
jgi:hypothetical protein